MKDKYLSIIIPVYKDSEGLKETVVSLLGNNKELSDFEIIISIDGGDKGDIDTAIKLINDHPNENITWHSNLLNKGSYYARNIGAKHAVGEVLAFLDAGVYVQCGWYVSLKKGIQCVDYIGGPVRVPEKWAKDIFELYESITAFPVKEYMEHNHFAPTANMVVRKEMFKQVGGFDGRLFSGGDGLFGTNVFEKGGRQLFVENLVVLHAPRNKDALRSKISRVTKGYTDLYKLYPENFNKVRSFIPFIKSVFNVFLRPSTFKSYRSQKFSYGSFVKVELFIAYCHFVSRLKYS